MSNNGNPGGGWPGTDFAQRGNQDRGQACDFAILIISRLPTLVGRNRKIASLTPDSPSAENRKSGSGLQIPRFTIRS
jgi:hypothetical protein